MALGDVKARFVRSDGQEMTLGDGTWRIPNDGLENWANLSYQVSSVEIPSSDGALVTSKRVNSVDRSVTAVLSKPSENEEMRASAISFFNPKYSYDVYMTYMGRTRWCNGELIGFKASEGNIYEGVRLDITILCPNPFLQSVDDFGKDIAEVQPMFMFPFTSFLPPEEGEADYPVGFVVGQMEFAKQVEIRNDGDVPSGMIVEITCEGQVKNPSITVGNAKVRLDVTLNAGDKVVLDASGKPPKITLNGDNALQLLTKDSNILDMVISVGETVIEYEADDGEGYMHVIVRYNKQYLGI